MIYKGFTNIRKSLILNLHSPVSRCTVSGHSMLPTLRPGQDLLVLRWFYKLKVGDLVVFTRNGTAIIKRIMKIGDRGLIVVGDNRSDSRDFGLIEKSEIIGKVFYIL